MTEGETAALRQRVGELEGELREARAEIERQTTAVSDWVFSRLVYETKGRFNEADDKLIAAFVPQAEAAKEAG